MNRLGTILIAGFLALAANAGRAAEVAGVHVDDQAKSGNVSLILNGAGLRTRFFFKVYVAALYAPKKTTKADEILDSREPRRIVMHMMRDLDADTLIGAFKEGLEANNSDIGLAALKPEIDQFESIMRSVGTAKTGDVVAIDLSPAGTSISFNGQPRGTVAGADFGRALLKVWLGDKPVDADLKQALLGG